jgi:hypothetical protein
LDNNIVFASAKKLSSEEGEERGEGDQAIIHRPKVSAVGLGVYQVLNADFLPQPGIFMYHFT